jgi:ubiquinone/menaquinone biosynthesis C-methylase UbiE
LIQSASINVHGASAAFDRMAGSYDTAFTESAIGRAQRRVIWDALRRVFRTGDRVLELNCGTGEDALFLAGRGVSVLACDASAGMIEVAERRKACEAPGSSLRFRVLRNEDLSLLQAAAPFDGALSNFSGVNCVADPRQVALDLRGLVKTGGRALICISTRVCLWEMAWYGKWHGTLREPISRKPSGAFAAAPLPSWMEFPFLSGIQRSAGCGNYFRRGSNYVPFAPSDYLCRRPTLTHGCADI